ncbi:MAG TPA: septum formation initiator family protein [Solirubrobacteraceae bacterium]|nr:septum formation initiator family protein [Solirubrobacteraceae bacterium]
MPPARSAARSHAAAPRRAPRASPPRPRLRARVASRGTRVRWDRVGRVSLLLVLIAVLGLYVQHALSYLSTRSQADAEQALVQQLARQNRALEAQRQALMKPATIIRDARALGMINQGERGYVITGQPAR